MSEDMVDINVEFLPDSNHQAVPHLDIPLDIWSVMLVAVMLLCFLLLELVLESLYPR